MLVILGSDVSGQRVRILAILLTMAGSSLPGCERDGHGERDRGERKVDALQQQVRRLSTQLSTLKIVVDGLTQPVPAGATIYEGFAAPQGDLVGGGSQVVVPKVDPAWLVP